MTSYWVSFFDRGQRVLLFTDDLNFAIKMNKVIKHYVLFLICNLF